MVERQDITQADVLSLINQQLQEIKKTNVPQLEMVGRVPEMNGDFFDQAQETGLCGKFLFFGRGTTYGIKGPPLGVPLKDKNNDSGWGHNVGVYLPSGEDRNKFTSSQEIKNKLDTLAEGIGSIRVVDRETYHDWEEGGMFAFFRRNAESGQISDERRKELQHNGRLFLEEEYFPTLVSVCGQMKKYHVKPGEIGLDDGDFGLLLRRFGSGKKGVATLRFSRLISTSHSKLRPFVAERDHMQCQFRTSPVRRALNVDDLIITDQAAIYRLPEDPRKEQMGVDNGNYLEDGEEEVCGIDLRGRHDPIYPASRNLDPVWGSLESHHILGRGAAFTSLQVYCLMAEQLKEVGEEVLDIKSLTPDQIILTLRALRIRDLVSSENFNLFDDEARVYRTLLANLPTYDRAVNSPFNLVTLCQDCHRLVHPDMLEIDNIVGFLEVVNSGVLNGSLTIQKGKNEALARLIEGDFVKQGRLVADYGKKMTRLHNARALVLAGGKLYWNSYNTDHMLDYARVRTREHMEEQRVAGLEEVFQNRPVNYSKFGFLSEPERYVDEKLPHANRRLDRLESFAKWFESMSS